MIKEEYVSFETAKLLKEKGFKEECIANYMLDVPDGKVSINTYGLLHSNDDYLTYSDIKFITAPTQSLAIRWLRENYNIHIVLTPSNWPQIGYWSKVYLYIQERNDFEKDKFVELKPTYEEATEVAIKYCLENLI